MPHSPRDHTPWMSPDDIPDPPSTSQYRLEPLNEHHAELDFEALMSCRARLREELQWGDWPPAEFTLELNREDLREHHGEFLRGEAFAYTVLDPDRLRCLGCIYLERCLEIQGAQLAFWTIDEARDLEPILVAEVLAWMHHAWEFSQVLIPIRDTNSHGFAVVQNLGLTEWHSNEGSSFAGHRCFLSAVNPGA